MDIRTYNHRKKVLKFREELLKVEEDRMRDSKGYSVAEVAAMSSNFSKQTETVQNKTPEISTDMLIFKGF